MYKQKIASALILGLSCAYGGGDIGSVNYDHGILEPIYDLAQSVSGDEGRFYIYGGVGASAFKVQSYLNNTGGSFDPDALKDKSTTGEIGMGYSINPDYSIETAYQRMNLTIANINNLNVAFNRYFTSGGTISPYIGIVAGFSSLTWSRKPHPIFVSSNLTSSSPMFGGQLGSDIKLTDNFFITAKYQYMYVNQKIDIQINKAGIQHSDMQNLMLGVKYAF